MQEGFFPLDDGIFVGKSISAIKKSKKDANSLIQFFGGKQNLPSSIMRSDQGRGVTRNKDEHAKGDRSYSATSPGLEKANDDKLPSMLRKAYALSGKGVGAGALSIFPQNIGRTMVLLYSDPWDLVFDPFAGHNSRMDLCVSAGRHYTGCDLSADFMKSNRKRARELRKLYPRTKIKLIEGDSRKIDEEGNIGDFSLTSPPYFDIEYYGDESEQLGKSKTYTDFLRGMQLVLRENFRILKPGKFAVWFINDFRKKNKMYFYHVDIIRLGEEAGFIAHDIMISDLGRGFRECFLNQIITSKILPKRHEYGVVFRKPE